MQAAWPADRNGDGARGCDCAPLHCSCNLQELRQADAEPYACCGPSDLCNTSLKLPGWGLSLFGRVEGVWRLGHIVESIAPLRSGTSMMLRNGERDMALSISVALPL